MSALYRKYRPSVFADVIAQEHITRTLANQIMTGRISHAYLFTGSRGTGKTTCARIFARAINCLDPQNGSPCGKCEVCRALAGGNIDVVELDAASNNGVNEIRELIESVQYPPVSGKYKVYIIDEVHMLTPQAFNALLKTLEEPPKHAVFVLATTEVHKILATVLSRCMRFDFHLVPQQILKQHLLSVYAKEGVTVDDEGANLIASAAEGSVRDLLSLADRCMNFSSALTYEDVLNIMGVGGREQTRTLFEAIAASDVSTVLSTIDEIVGAGKSVPLVAKDLCSYARDLLVLKTSAKASVIATKEEREKMLEAAARHSTDTLVTVISEFSAIDQELRYSVSPRIVLECCGLRAAKLVGADLSRIEERLLRLEKKVESGVLSPAPTSTATAVSKSVRTDREMTPRAVWGRITTYVRLNEQPRVLGLMDFVEKVEIKGNKLILSAGGDNFMQIGSPDFEQAIVRALDADGAALTVEINKLTGGVDMDSEIEHIKKLIGDAKLNVKK